MKKSERYLEERAYCRAHDEAERACALQGFGYFCIDVPQPDPVRRFATFPTAIEAMEWFAQRLNRDRAEVHYFRVENGKYSGWQRLFLTY